MPSEGIAVPLIVCISFASGVIAGVFSMRYFGAYSWVHRYFTFWPAFCIVGVGVFFLCNAIFLLIFGAF
jgi:hypothetical protein